MLKSSVHNHSTWCDGKNTLEEMAAAACSAGFTDFGFSGHTYVGFVNFGVRDELAYAAQIRQLAKEYQGRMCLYAGMEHDYYYPVAHREVMDYIIGSVHEIQSPAIGRRYIIDGPKQSVLACREEVFGGDGLAMAEYFYEITAKNAEQYRPEVIGHFDLIVKNNADGSLFDELSPRYRSAALDALACCCAADPVFEVNTGGIFRGYRAKPYPDPFLLRELLERNARVMINADAHETAAICFYFSECLELLHAIGYRSIWVWEKGEFVERGIAELSQP